MNKTDQKTVACCVLMVALSNGSYLTLSNYLIPLSDALHLSVAQVSGIHVVSGGVNLLASVLMGWTLKKMKCGTLLTVSGGCMFLFYMGISVSREFYGLILGAIPFGLSMVWGGYAVCQTVLESVGSNRPSRVMSLLPVGAGVGAFVLSPLIAFGIERIGLHITALLQGCLCGGTMLVLGLSERSREREYCSRTSTEEKQDQTILPHFVHSVRFWMVLTGSFLFLLASGGFAGNAAPIYTQMDCDSMQASYAISIRSIVQLGWAVGFGMLVDRYGPVPIVGLYCVAAAGAFVAALTLKGFGGAVIVAILNGSMSIGATIGAICFAKMYGGKVGGGILGLSNGMLGLSLTCGAPMAAAMLDLTGSYRLFLYSAIVMTLGCWLLVLGALEKKTVQTERLNIKTRNKNK